MIIYAQTQNIAISVQIQISEKQPLQKHVHQGNTLYAPPGPPTPFPTSLLEHYYHLPQMLCIIIGDYN